MIEFDTVTKSLPTFKHTDVGQNKRTTTNVMLLYSFTNQLTYMFDQSEMIF